MNEPSSETNIVRSSQLTTQIILILVGLVASGKSTFAKALELHNPQFRRCNQDDLGTRRAVENLARQSLRQGYSVCIDRTNVDETQRAHWINIAREVPGISVWCLVFDTPQDVCAARLQTRTGHPTITSPEQGLRILHGFAGDFRIPSFNEGFDRISYIRPSEHPSPTYTAEDINIILGRIGDSENPGNSGIDDPSVQLRQQRDFMSRFVTRGRGGSRGYGHGEWRASRGGRSFFGRGRGRSRPFQYRNSDITHREWTNLAPIRRQSPHSGQHLPRINDFEGRAAIARPQYTDSDVSVTIVASDEGSADSPIVIS